MRVGGAAPVARRQHRPGAAVGDRLLHHQQGAGQGRRSRRARGRRPALPVARCDGGRGRQDLEGVSEHARPGCRQCARPHRRGALEERQGHHHRQGRRRAPRREQRQQADRAHREGRHRQRARRHAEHARRPDGLAAGRHRVPGRRGSHVRQLDEERPGRGDGRSSRRAGTARRRRVEVVELVASLARARRRLQPERSEEHGRQRPLLLLRDQVAQRGRGAENTPRLRKPARARRVRRGSAAARHLEGLLRPGLHGPGQDAGDAGGPRGRGGHVPLLGLHEQRGAVRGSLRHAPAEDPAPDPARLHLPLLRRPGRSGGRRVSRQVPDPRGARHDPGAEPGRQGLPGRRRRHSGDVGHAQDRDGPDVVRRVGQARHDRLVRVSRARAQSPRRGRLDHDEGRAVAEQPVDGRLDGRQRRGHSGDDARRAQTAPPAMIAPLRRRRYKDPMSKLAPFAATLLVFALLATSALAQAPRDVLVVGMEAEPPGLDPGQALGLHTLRVTAEIFETLVVTAPDSTDVVPGLAESWTTSADGLAWTFKLRRGVRFHDGTPLDAAAVKFTFDRVIDPAHAHAKSGKWTFVTGYLSSVKAVEVLDPQTVQLQLKYPTASLLALLALPNCAIVSPTAFTKSPADFDTKPVGSGRYKVESWERGSRLVLRRNDDYWGSKGKPQTLVYRGLAEANARVAELLTGGVDLILPIPPDFVARLEKTAGVTVHKATGLTVWYVGFNVDKKPFTDRRVRQAFSHAVNREAITRDILKGTGIPAIGPLLPGTWAFEPNVRKYPYDVAAAKKLLAEAGYPNGLETDLWVPESGSGMQAPVEMATVIQANLAAASVKAQLKTFEWGSYLGKVRAEAPALYALSWFLKSEDPDLSMYPLFFSKNTPLPNRSNYNNPEVDQLLVQARQTSDRARRIELYRKAQRLIVEDAPMVFVDHEVQVVATRANVKGFRLHPSGFDLRVENATKE